MKWLAAVVGAQHDGVQHIDAVGIVGIGLDAGEIPAALTDALVGGDMHPVPAVVVGAVEAAFAVLRIDQREDAGGLARA